jgi:hypothetical protein
VLVDEGGSHHLHQLEHLVEEVGDARNDGVSLDVNRLEDKAKAKPSRMDSDFE